MSKLSDIATKETLVNYVQGAAQRAIQPIADFIAPTVEVGKPRGLFKVYSAKSRFRLPSTRRAPGARATVIGFETTDDTYNCEPNALDCPIDISESDADAELVFSLQEAADMVSSVAGLAHEKEVIDAAVGALSPTTSNWTGSVDPVDAIDTQILNVLKAAKFGSLMSARVVFGANAWRIFKNSDKVRGKIVVSPKGGGGAGTGLAIPDINQAGQFFVGNPDVRASYMVYDSAAEGQAESISFMLDSKVLIFACLPTPTRLDPSFMKTFRLRGRWMVPGSYERDDGRVEVAKYDWSEQIKVTNSSAAALLSIT